MHLKNLYLLKKNYFQVWIACRTNQEDSEMPNHEMDLLSGHENDVNYVQFRLTSQSNEHFWPNHECVCILL